MAVPSDTACLDESQTRPGARASGGRGFGGVARWFLIGLLLSAGPSAAQEAVLDVLFDLDRNAATGCDVATPEGPAPGIELRLRTRVDVGAATLTTIEHADCVDEIGGVFGPGVQAATAPLPAWSVSPGNGVEGSTLVETHVPGSVFGGARRADVFVALDVAGAGDAMSSGSATGLEVSLVALAVPTMGTLGLGVAMLVVVGLGSSLAGRRTALVMSLAVVGGGALAVGHDARALLGDGLHRVWPADALVAADPAGDGPPGADLLGLSSALDPATGELWLRVDVAFGPAVCLDWGLVSAGAGYSCSQWPALDPGPFAGPVALTFDDGPNPATTPQILATLRAWSAPATFFMVGSNLTTPEEQALALEIHQDPLFRVATHSVGHPNFTDLSPSEVEYEVDEGLARLRDAIGDPCWFPSYFRFPFGASDCTSMEIVRRRGLAVAGVNMDSVDWCYAAGGGRCLPSIVPDIEPEAVDDLPGKVLIEYLQHGGGILLLHDVHPTTVAALPSILADLQAAGATFVDLGDPVVFPNLDAAIGAPEAPACCVLVGP